MTNKTLSYILRGINTEKGEVVNTVEDLKAIWIPNHQVRMGDYTDHYDFLVLMKGNKKAG